MVFYGIEDLADLKGGGEFLRPVNKGLKELSLPEIDLMVIPACFR
ncbi:MAG: hypothetical protein U1F57_12020 [bacterium]